MSRSTAEWVIHFSGDDYWNSNHAVRHHLCRALHTRYQILWVNPIGNRFPSIRKKGFVGKIVRKLASIFKLLCRVDHGYFVVTPFTLPVFRSSAALKQVNQALFRLQLAAVLCCLRIRNPAAFHTTPLFAHMSAGLRVRRTVFYYADQYSLYRELTPAARHYVEELEAELQARADCILCCSHMILDRVSPVAGPRTRYFPHQVDYHKFAAAAGAGPSAVPRELVDIRRPIIGYYGTLTDSNDWDVIRYCAERRPHYHFVFIGHKGIAHAGVEHLPNVHFIGQQPYARIQEFGAAFDVAIMFWVRREWIKHCSPLKLREYLALGKPVVSTRIEEVEREFGNIVYCAETAEGFLDALDQAVSGQHQDRTGLGQKRVSQDRWENILPYFEEGDVP